MSKEEEERGLKCQLLVEIAHASTGRNISSVSLPHVMILKRKGGLLLYSNDPPFKKGLKTQEKPCEVYSGHISQGKLTIIKRDGSKLHQYNIRGADPDYLIALKQFLIQEGGISKTPSTVSRSRDEGTCSFSGRAPLGDRTKEISSQLNRTRDRRTGEIDNPLHPSPNKRNPKARKKEPQQLKDQEQMTSKQKQILQAVLEKKSLFFTGSAGTGKSFLLRCILSILAPKARIYATGTTGIAAYHIGGITLHHFAGIDSRPYSSVDAMVQNICKKKDALTRWKSVQILVIDEISMLDGDLFDDLEQVARRIRKNESFFGGIQVVLCGDFFQLPPVSKKKNVPMCFESNAWKKGIHHIYMLTDIFRQSDPEFVNTLNTLRTGPPTNEILSKLNSRYKQEVDPEAIHIFTHNDAVLETNKQRLEELPERKYNFIAVDSGKTEYLAGIPAPVTVTLKKNAQVMLIKTIGATNGLVNGSRGTIQGFTSQEHLPIVRFSNGVTEIIRYEDFSVRLGDTVLASRRQIPLTLAWAISIHKSQGLTFDAAVLDLSRVFEHGQAYVALSRIRSFEGVCLRSKVERKHFIVRSNVVSFYDQLQ